MSTRLVLILYCVVTVSSAAPTSAEEQVDGLRRFIFERVEMGVQVRMSVYASESGVANKAIEAAYARVHELNGILSDYDSSSEVRRLCETSRPGRPVRVSRELFQVLKSSLQLSRDSDGAFDVTVGPLTKLWRRASRRELLPDPVLLAEAKNLVNYRLIRLNAESETVELLLSGMRIDLGGIAKGFAADEAISTLAKHGITRALVDASGDIVASDPPPGADHWVVAIESLSRRTADKNKVDLKNTNDIVKLKIRNQAVATSGDAYQSVVIAGRRYSHIVDPRTGLGLGQRSSVTVIAPSGMLADSLASAVSVSGPDAGTLLIEQSDRPDTESYIMSAREESGQVSVMRSSGFEKFLLK